MPALTVQAARSRAPWTIRGASVRRVWVALRASLPLSPCDVDVDDYEEVIGNHHVTVAERDGAIVGILVLAVDDEGFLIDNVAAHPSHRGTGLGSPCWRWRKSNPDARASIPSTSTREDDREPRPVLEDRLRRDDRRSQWDSSRVYMRKQLG